MTTAEHLAVEMAHSAPSSQSEEVGQRLTFARSVSNEDTLRGALIMFLAQPTNQSSYSPREL